MGGPAEWLFQPIDRASVDVSRRQPHQNTLPSTKRAAQAWGSDGPLTVPPKEMTLWTGKALAGRRLVASPSCTL